MSLNMKFWGIFFGILFALIIGLVGWFAVFANTATEPIAFPSRCPDNDGDTLSDCEEMNLYFTEIYNPDTDGDGYSDGEEIAGGYSPHVGDKARLEDVDSDKDGLNDALELKFSISLYAADTDGDGYSDYEEIQNGYDPNNLENKRLKKSIEVDTAANTLTYLVKNIPIGSVDLREGAVSLPNGSYEVWYKKDRVWSNAQERWITDWMAIDDTKYGIYADNEHSPEGIVLDTEHAALMYDWTPIGTKVLVK